MTYFKRKSQKEWIDISVPLRNGMVNWPDDPPLKIERVLDLDQGDRTNVSMVSMCLHTGTHIDAPLHYFENGNGVDNMPFDATVGLARVIEIFDEKSIKSRELINHRICKGERLLFKTKNSIRCWKNDTFVKDFVFISLDAAEFLVDCKVRSVGIDYLSVDGFRDEESKTHMTFLEAGIWIIEGLNLSRVEHGKYQLICLPLNIIKSDGAPARAIVKRA